MTSCFNQKQQIKQNQDKITFIFDFDDTMYNAKTENNQKHRSYVDMFYESVFKSSGYERNDIELWVSKNIRIANSPEGVYEFMRRLHDKFHIKVQQKDIDYCISELKKVQTKNLKEIILKLKSQGHQVLIIGGGTWGCSIIPDFAKQFGIEKSDIYSGYFKDFSYSEITKVLFDKYRYTNCGNLDLQTPVSFEKSEVIKFLKKEGIIKGKVIHIGDGENDLEVWKAGEADKFIGFGINRYSTKVEDGSEIYVKTIEDFKNEIDKVLLQKMTINKISIDYVENDISNKDQPSIYAKLPSNKYNAWVQIVDTNSESESGKWKHFVDYDQNLTKYPIYTYNKIFYDAPQWNVPNGITLEWKANTFPVEVKDGKIVSIGKGFSWGFTATGSKVQMIRPKAFEVDSRLKEELVKNSDNKIIQVNADVKKGFYSDYFYQISDLTTRDKEIYIAILPNNTPGTIIPEDYGDYKTLWNGYAKTWGINSGMSKLLRDKLPIITLSPAFPTQDNSGTYSNVLNKKSINDARKEWNRQDLQLIEIIKDLKNRLKKEGYKIHDKVLFYGFSSQADFANRFALLHPQLVEAVAVGGIVDYITLPISEYKNQKLNYPLGVADVKGIDNNEFNLDEFRKIKFFWYDGADDTNTTFKKCYKVWSDNDIDITFQLFTNRKYDENRVHDKKILKNCLKILKENGVNFEYKTYPKIKHYITQEMKNDVVKFFDKILNPKPTQHNLIIYPGRFQPFHQGHYDMIKEAEKHGKHVLIAISQAKGMQKDERNIFSGDDREKMIRDTLEKDGFKNYSIIQLDYIGKDKTLKDWDNNLIKIAKSEYKRIYRKEPKKEDIGFIYYDRDKANYDKRFGNDFSIIEVKSSFDNDISATEIRKEFFEEGKIDDKLPSGTKDFLKHKSQKIQH